MKIDNFMLTMHQTCPAKYDLRINQQWTVRRRSAALGFGGTIHEGLKEWYLTHNLDAACAAIETHWPAEMPTDDWRTRSKCVDVMCDYIATYPSETFQVLGAPPNQMVEVAFAFETGMYLSCAKCGTDGGTTVDGIVLCSNCMSALEPIEYGGIFDTLIDFSGQVFILEHKTTSQLGKFYFNQFKPNNQITGYVWGARKLSGRSVSGALINAIGIYKLSPTRFERHLTSRNDQDIATWLKDVKAVAEEIQFHKLHGYWPRRTAACQLYGSCEFHSVHVLSTELEQQKRLENDYVKDQWDFERRDEPTSSDT